jgi:hypothetical protein
MPSSQFGSFFGPLRGATFVYQVVLFGAFRVEFGEIQGSFFFAGLEKIRRNRLACQEILSGSVRCPWSVVRCARSRKPGVGRLVLPAAANDVSLQRTKDNGQRTFFSIPRHPVLQATPDEPRGPDHDEDHQDGVEAMEVLAEGAPAFAQLDAGVGQDQAPRE